MPTKWTREDRRRAKTMHAHGLELDEIAHAMGTSGKQAWTLVYGVTPPKDPSPLVRLLASLGEGSVIPPPWVIDEAIARAEYPRTTSQLICGDPVLNQCALFRMNHGDRL